MKNCREKRLVMFIVQQKYPFNTCPSKYIGYLNCNDVDKNYKLGCKLKNLKRITSKNSRLRELFETKHLEIMEHKQRQTVEEVEKEYKKLHSYDTNYNYIYQDLNNHEIRCCGKKISRQNISRHRKSKKHIDNKKE